MCNNILLGWLYSFNIHLGHLANFNSKLNNYILGKRFNFFIIDLTKMLFLLKKALLFLVHLSLKNGSVLFKYSVFSKLNILYKCFLVSIVNNCKQQLITHNWFYGSISNYYFSFFNFMKSITTVWLNKTTYLFNQLKDNNKFNSFEYDNKKYYRFNYLAAHAKTHSNKSITRKLTWYNIWHTKWVKKQKQYLIWQYKKNALKQTNFVDNIFFNEMNTVWKKNTLLNFKYIFLKVFFFINLKKKDPFFLNLDYKLLLKYDYDRIHKKVMSNWRLALYFRHLNDFFKLPDVLFYIFPNGNELPIKEYTNNNLVSMGLVDTNSSIDTLNYPIVSNDDSILLVIFYFTLCSNIFLESRLTLYSYLISHTKN